MKKLLIFLICLAMLGVLCACGEGGELPTPPSVSPSGAGASAEPSDASAEPSDASVEPSAEASNDPSAAPSGDTSVEPSAEVSSDPSAAPSVEPTDEPSDEPAPTPVQHFADLSDYGIVEDGNTEYPIVIRYMDASNISDDVVEFSKQFVELLTGEPIDAVRAMRFENVRVAEATISGDKVAVYNIAVSLAMRDGFPPEGDLWEEDHSHGIDDHGWYYNTYAAHKPCMLAVTLNGELFCAANANALGEKYDIDAQFWHSAEEAEPILRAVYEEHIADAPQDGYTFELSPDWAAHELLFGIDIDVRDADGNDISGVFYELWQSAQSVYGGGFESGDWVTGIYEAIPTLSGIEQLGVEERLDELFTENGKAQVLDASQGGLPLLLHREEDDTWWYPEPRSSGWSVDLLGVDTLSVSDGRVELMLRFGGHNAPEWSASTRFVMVETADGWRIDDYPHYRADYGPGELYRVIDGYDSGLMTYLHSEGHLFIEDMRFLGGYWSEGESVCIAWLKDGALSIELSQDVYDRGRGYSEYGPTVEYTVDLASGTITEYRYYNSLHYASEGNFFGVDFTEAELLCWGLMIADVFDDAEARLYAEHGELAGSGVEIPDVLDADKLRNMLDGARGYREHNLELFDAEGRDISDEIIDLWIIGNHIYSGSVFDYDDGSYYGEEEARIYNFDEVADAFYTDAGEAQLREAQFSTSGNFFFERDGEMWDLRPGARMTWAVPDNIVGASVVEQTDTRIALDITYDMAWKGEEPDCSTVRFVVEKDGIGWKIADYDPPMVWMPGREATITAEDGLAETAADDYMYDFALDIARIASLGHAIEEYGCRITEVVVEGVEEAASMPVAEGGRYVMMRVNLRMKPDRLPDADLGEYIEVDENGWITRDVVGDWYMAYYQSASGRWYSFSRDADIDIERKFGEPEDIAEHGDALTALMNAYYEHSFDQVQRQIAETEPDAAELQK